MVILFMRMKQPQRMFYSRDIISQYEIQLIGLPGLSRNRSDGIVRFPAGLCINMGIPVAVFPPYF